MLIRGRSIGINEMAIFSGEVIVKYAYNRAAYVEAFVRYNLLTSVLAFLIASF